MMNSLFKKMNLTDGVNDRREVEDCLLMARENEIVIVEMKDPYEKCLNISYVELEFPQLTTVENIIKEIKEKVEKDWGTENAICLNYLDDDMDRLKHLAIENNIRFR